MRRSFKISWFFVCVIASVLLVTETHGWAHLGAYVLLFINSAALVDLVRETAKQDRLPLPQDVTIRIHNAYTSGSGDKS